MERSRAEDSVGKGKLHEQVSFIAKDFLARFKSLV